ncbi:hypothetical protein AcW1_000755 [Taiwanofungus camphoratus]|nr:hypothetical protein AcW2_000741 [Antrodia cinnamomea]KAI0936554.1 hypothetical protein AcV5_004657 [Antrodia cinnamomea]KAI0961769.1 hypothetical protein AcV7_000777 [Antrodia cinnamomea]KAI0963775.1 hypothetical protein AcW1_000755 [Antrodia cinnamomea]
MNRKEARPLSSLHLALRRMTALNHLRVFQCRQGIPIILPRLNSTGIAISFENAMYPDGCRHRLASYELFVDSETRVSAFEAISPQSVEVLRLSGDCRLPATPWTPALRQVTLYGITGNYFDQHAVDECFPGARLESFMYGLGHRLGFEIRNRHLESLAAISGPNLRKLVLLGCSRLSSAVIAACLQNLPSLEHLALGLVTVDELRTNFILALPPTISVFMLQIMNAWYAVALLTEERSLCEAIEGTVLLRTVPPRHACLNFRDRLMNEAGRRQRWEEIARNRHFDLDIGPWESSYLEEL